MPYQINIGKMGPCFKWWWQTCSKRALFSSKAPFFLAWRRLTLDWNWPSRCPPLSSTCFNLSFNNWISLSRLCTSVSAVVRLSITLISRLSLSLSLSWFPIQTHHKLFSKQFWSTKGISIICKVHNSYSILFLIRAPTFEWYVVTPRMDTKKACAQKKSNYVLKCDSHSNLNSKHNWADLLDHLPSMRILSLIRTKILIGPTMIRPPRTK